MRVVSVGNPTFRTADSLERIANSLERIAKCLEDNNR